MRVVVNLNRCQGYAQCCFLAPEAFKLIGEEALLYDPAPDNELSEEIVRAAAACPVQAIFFEHTTAQRDDIVEKNAIKREASHGH